MTAALAHTDAYPERADPPQVTRLMLRCLAEAELAGLHRGLKRVTGGWKSTAPGATTLHSPNTVTALRHRGYLKMKADTETIHLTEIGRRKLVAIARQAPHTIEDDTGESR